jgi:acyl-coenzyme A thioesterase PaaI-like protein
MNYLWVTATVALAILVPSLISLARIILFASRNPYSALKIYEKCGEGFPFNLSTSLANRVFNVLLGITNPFFRTGFGSGLFQVVTFKEGHMRATLTEHKSLRNPFRSIHACALCLLGETVSGLAVFSTFGRGDQGIVSKIECEYFSKCRGVVVADCVFKRPNQSKDGKALDQEVVVDILDNITGRRLAAIIVHWNLKLVQ